jgi:hypothetical protein
MCGVPVLLHRSIITILFVDEEVSRIRLKTVHYVHQASGLFARLTLELPKNIRHVFLVRFFGDPCHGENNHAAIVIADIPTSACRIFPRVTLGGDDCHIDEVRAGLK